MGKPVVGISVFICSLLASTFFCNADGPATKSAAPQVPRLFPFSPLRVAQRILGKRVNGLYVRCEYVGKNLALVRLEDTPWRKGEKKRVHYFFRAVVDTNNEQVLSIAGDYQAAELENIDAARPKGTLKAAEALAAAAKSLKDDGFTYPPPSDVDIDLVGGRYYVIRYPDPDPQRGNGNLNPIYSARLIVDAVSGKLEEMRLGDEGVIDP
jgi:hypothetical protein